jgi:hypothetical protein
MNKKIIFKDYPEFKPNLTPYQIFKSGAFGGTYWRPIYSSITKKKYKNQYKKYDWKDISKEYLCSNICDKLKNKYKVNSGTSLEYWEKKGWIHPQDPYGWIQWYCEFYNGRRTKDDKRQIKRWLNFAGPNGRFRKRLIKLIKINNTKYNDYQISPIIRQGLLHWAYELTNEDYKYYIKNN